MTPTITDTTNETPLINSREYEPEDILAMFNAAIVWERKNCKPPVMFIGHAALKQLDAIVKQHHYDTRRNKCL